MFKDRRTKIRFYFEECGRTHNYEIHDRWQPLKSRVIAIVHDIDLADRIVEDLNKNNRTYSGQKESSYYHKDTSSSHNWF